ncbi:MAG: iron-sulfur cluster assembly accessory protein [Gammaproteobacteria bacterium]|nr:iron-sulfur cluster assembly accessory protein [Gammaproteobacteria bacterium]MBU1655023.1 iron-sulfur cluster assembly accessory protein [Gammaproteobacteria bacterium]MBU1960329.1 iron-sulfur cluster assembly accessory protein [Gammaproteobacteria bacterium]
MFKVTEAAADQIRNAAQQSGADGMPLRLAAHTRPDGSIDYRMGFDEESDEDITFKCEGVTILMGPEYVPLLDETLLDFVALDEGDQQFIFHNPKDPHYKPPQG